MASDLQQELIAIVGAERVSQNAPLAPLTTFKVGGPADWLVEPRTADEVRRVIAAARAFGRLSGGQQQASGKRARRRRFSARDLRNERFGEAAAGAAP